MSDKKYVTEKRKWARYRVNEGAFVKFTKPRFFKFTKPRMVKLAPILDICDGGLAFQYEGQSMWSIDSNEMSISLPDDQMKIENVPFKIISDHKVYGISDSRDYRRCGVQFEQLTSDQKHQIDTFMHNHAMEPSTSPRAPISNNDGWYYVDLTTRR